MEKILSEIYSRIEDKDLFKIWRLTRCDLCSKPATKPIFLPCCYSICRSHLPVDKFLAPNHSVASSVTFVCHLCHKSHDIPRNGFVKNPKRRQIQKMKASSPLEYEKFKEWSNFVLAADSELIHFYHSILYPLNEIGFLCDEYGLRVDKQRELVPHKLEKLKQSMINEVLEWRNSCMKKIRTGKMLPVDMDESFMHSLMHINFRSEDLNPLQYQDYAKSLINLCKFEFDMYPKAEAQILDGLMYCRRAHFSSPYRLQSSKKQNNFFDDRIKGIDYESYVFTIQNLKEMIKNDGSLLKMIHFNFLNYKVILETNVTYDAEGKNKFLSFKLKFRDTGPGEEVDMAAQVRLLSNQPTEHFGKSENMTSNLETFEISFDKFMPIEEVLTAKYYKSAKDMIRIDLIIFKRRFMQRVK
ncbi:hypothetical protein BpHYR1_037994 [Brachionus plicatilis]|uniref:Uncharacterized protein n=1 Tax=Brachionus plicatilis TaxID=10195 RepID=A0A3M7QZF7_BRAPC|nr:hypothetical protein BpHYR1_037994 [Brachionus plicatilis]